APVAQDMIEPRECRLVIPAIHLVGDGQIFGCVEWTERDGACLASGAGILQCLAAQEDEGCSNAPARACAGETQLQWKLARGFDRHMPTHVACAAPERNKCPPQAHSSASEWCRE